MRATLGYRQRTAFPEGTPAANSEPPSAYVSAFLSEFQRTAWRAIHVRRPAQVSIRPQNLAFCLGLFDHERNNDNEERAPHGRAVRHTKKPSIQRRKRHVDCQTYSPVGGSRARPARRPGHGRRPGARRSRSRGFGAMSGVVRSFGINSKAALEAAADQINKAGGVTLGDGSKGKIVIDFLDDRCNAEEGISVLRRIASGRRAGRDRPDLLQRRRAAVRRPAEEGRRRQRHRPAVPDLHRRRHQDRARQDLRMGVPQRAQRDGDVRHALQVAEGDQARPQDASTAASRRISPTRAPPGMRS